MTQHTPTPWAYETDESKLNTYIYTAKPYYLAVLHNADKAQREEDAAFIVKAVNEYDRLNEALERMISKAADYAVKLNTSLNQSAELEAIIQKTILEMQQRGQRTWANELTDSLKALAKAKGAA